MAVQSGRVTVTTSATRLDASAESDYNPAGDLAFSRVYGQSCLVRNRGSVSVFLGGAGVAAGTGFELEADQSVAVDLAGTDALHGITASGSALCHVLQSGV
jgi:hypothetical protein